jgi:tetratricopeptide (TPR) repeat protein
MKMQQEALEYFQRTGNLYLETHLLARMSKLYSDQGNVQKALALKRAFTAKNQVLKDTVLDIAVAKYEVEHNGQLGKYSIARYEASNALRLAEQIKRNDYITWGQYSVGRYSFLDRDYNMAVFFLKKAEKSAPRANVSMRRDISRQLSGAYAAAHDDYLAARAALKMDVPEVEGISAGGMPNRVKCLHSLVAHSLSAGPGVNPLGDEALAQLPEWWKTEPCE